MNDPRTGMTAWQELKWGLASWRNFKYSMRHMRTPEENRQARLEAFDKRAAQTGKALKHGAVASWPFLKHPLKVASGTALGLALVSGPTLGFLVFGLLFLLLFFPLGLLLLAIAGVQIVIGVVGGIIGVYRLK